MPATRPTIRSTSTGMKPSAAATESVLANIDEMNRIGAGPIIAHGAKERRPPGCYSEHSGSSDGAR